LHGNTMKPLGHVRNQMLAGARELTCLDPSRFDSS
jgi:hypothetical protein